MSLDHILLGILRSPASGYDIKAFFGENNFWHAELSQVYPALNRLEGRGLLSSDTVASTSGPDRRVYHLTESGSEELRTWLTGSPEIGVQKQPHLAQLFFMQELKDPERTIHFLTQLRALLTDRLAFLQKRETELVSGGSWDYFEPETFHQYAVLRYGLLSASSNLAWCDETIDRLKILIDRNPQA
jgi:PadR family transcriptional regulator AphA